MCTKMFFGRENVNADKPKDNYFLFIPNIALNCEELNPDNECIITFSITAESEFLI